MEKIRYFDHAATTNVREEVLKEMLPYFSIEYGNPSSLYSLGRRSHKAVELSREKVAKSINAMPKEIYYTSCGSEGNNLAIKGVARANKNKGNHIITTKIEHPAVLHTCKSLEKDGFEVTYINVDENGIINLNELKNSIKKETILISVMYANNEIGTIQPIEEIGKIANSNNIYFHTDAVQAIGNIKIDVKKMNIDLLTISGHKFYGPKGIGALYANENVKFDKIQDGGHQEKDKRAGTENVAGIVGIGKAIEIAYKEIEKNNNNLRYLRDYYVQQIENKIPYIKINGDRIRRLPGNSNISFEGIEGEELLYKLDIKGICASSGSACTSGTMEPSHVLTSIGLPYKLAQGALRITLGIENTKEDIDYLVNTLEEIIKKIRNK